MAKVFLKPGDSCHLVTDEFDGDAIVLDVKSINTSSQNGFLIRYNASGYGETQYFYSSSGILDGQISNRQNRSGMPAEYMSKTGKDFKWDLYDCDVEEIKQQANDFILGFKDHRLHGSGLFIHSATRGSGKTLLSCCIGNEIIKRYDVPVKFTSTQEYIEILRGRRDIDQQRKEDIQEAALLIIDDIGATVDDQTWIRNAIFYLIDKRHRNMLPVIFTSNLELEKLKYDGRVIDRIAEDCLDIHMPEVNVRRKKSNGFKNRLFDEISKKHREEMPIWK